MNETNILRKLEFIVFEYNEQIKDFTETIPPLKLIVEPNYFIIDRQNSSFNYYLLKSLFYLGIIFHIEKSKIVVEREQFDYIEDFVNQ